VDLFAKNERCHWFPKVKTRREIRIENQPSALHSRRMTASRLPIPQYAMALAHVASLRSEDPYRKVGAAALDFDNRVIGTAYNGLAPGYNPPSGFWDDREARQKFMLHAEVNLCSLFRRGEAKIVATTTMPCTSCMQTLCAYGIKEIYYQHIYHISDAPEIAALYRVKLEQVKEFPGSC
jgi:dCMP deaminase